MSRISLTAPHVAKIVEYLDGCHCDETLQDALINGAGFSYEGAKKGVDDKSQRMIDAKIVCCKECGYWSTDVDYEFINMCAPCADELRDRHI